MPTTPVGPNGIFRLHYTAMGLPHLINMRVKYKTPIVYGVMPTILSAAGSGFDRTSDDLMTLLGAAVIPMYLPADHLDSYECIDVSTIPPTFIFSRSVTGYAGTHTGGTTQRQESQVTLTMRDAIGKRLKWNWFATAEGGVGRGNTYSAHVWNAFIVGMLPSLTPPVLNDYFYGRSGQQIVSFMSWSLQANNALERRILHP